MVDTCRVEWKDQKLSGNYAADDATLDAMQAYAVDGSEMAAIAWPDVDGVAHNLTPAQLGLLAAALRAWRKGRDGAAAITL